MVHALEIRRQILHFLYGLALVALLRAGFLNADLLLALTAIGAGTSLLVKHHRPTPLMWVLGFFERAHHLERFPGRGVLFFTAGAYLAVLLFPPAVAQAGIMVLATGDAVSNLFGRHFGRIKAPLNPEKYMEGVILGIATSIPMAYFFVPSWPAAAAAATVAMFLEIPHWRLFGFEVDDNLIIPVAAGFTLHLITG